MGNFSSPASTLKDILSAENRNGMEAYAQSGTGCIYRQRSETGDLFYDRSAHSGAISATER
jgi:hypothetical protein